MGKIKFKYLGIFIFLAACWGGCVLQNQNLDPPQGDWIITKYKIAQISTGDKGKASDWVGRKLTIEGERLIIDLGNRNYICGLRHSRINKIALKEDSLFAAAEKGSFNLREWAGSQDQDLIEIHLNFPKIPFLTLTYLEKDQKMIAVGKDAAFLLEPIKK